MRNIIKLGVAWCWSWWCWCCYFKREKEWIEDDNPSPTKIFLLPARTEIHICNGVSCSGCHTTAKRSQFIPLPLLIARVTRGKWEERVHPSLGLCWDPLSDKQDTGRRRVGDHLYFISSMKQAPTIPRQWFHPFFVSLILSFSLTTRLPINRYHYYLWGCLTNVLWEENVINEIYWILAIQKISNMH